MKGFYSCEFIFISNVYNIVYFYDPGSSQELRLCHPNPHRLPPAGVRAAGVLDPRGA